MFAKFGDCKRKMVLSPILFGFEFVRFNLFTYAYRQMNAPVSRLALTCADDTRWFRFGV